MGKGQASNMGKRRLPRARAGRMCRDCKGAGKVPRRHLVGPFAMSKDTTMETCAKCQGRGTL